MYVFVDVVKQVSRHCLHSLFFADVPDVILHAWLGG